MTSRENAGPITWGIIGCGDVAERKGGPALWTAEGSRVAAVVSRRPDRAADFARRHGIARHYDHLDALLADDTVDAVYLATPPDTHAELTVRAAEASKHVLCEKPMALTVAECERMVRACRHHGVQLAVAYYRRFFPVVRMMARLLRDGVIGEPVRAHTTAATSYRPPPGAEPAWRTDPAVAGGGFLTDVGVHRLDLLTHLLGPVREVAALIDTLHFDFAADDSSSLLLRFEAGPHATAAFHWNVGVGIDELEVSGTQGRLVSRHLDAGDLEVITRSGTDTRALPPSSPTHLGLVEHVVDSLRSQTPNAVSGEEGLQATAITEAAYRSASQGRSVRLSPGDRR